MIELELPYPPSVNHYWRHVGPRTLISRGGRAFRAAVCSLLAAQNLTPLIGYLAVEVEVFPPDRRRRDIDNVTKSLLDALQHGGVYLDDSQIVLLSIQKCDLVAGGKAIVRIREVAY